MYIYSICYIYHIFCVIFKLYIYIHMYNDFLKTVHFLILLHLHAKDACISLAVRNT